MVNNTSFTDIDGVLTIASTPLPTKSLQLVQPQIH